MQGRQLIEKLNGLREYHKQIFGIIDLKSQARKFGEELVEFYEAEKKVIDEGSDDDNSETYSKAREEAADCFIVIAGIMNVNKDIGLKLLHLMENENITSLLYEDVIDNKMKINEQRKKIKVDGVIYHE